MKVLLVWPNRGEYGLKPIGISLISAILKEQNHEVELFDTTFFNLGLESADDCRKKIKIFKEVDFGDNDMSKKDVDLEEEFLKKINSFRPDIVGISALFDEKEISFKLSRISKEWNSNVVVLWGNKFATMSCDEVLDNDYVDYVCIGEGIKFIKDFIDYLSGNLAISKVNNLAYRNNRGNIIKNNLSPYFQDLDSLPFLDWSIMDNRQFIRAYDGNVYIAGDHMILWGCPNCCTYCINESYRELYKNNCDISPGKFIRSYSVDRIIDELEYQKIKWGLTFMKFQDEDFCLKSVSYLEELKDKYAEKVNLPFACMVSARTATKEKLKIMKEMNCVSISIGIENGNDFIRKNILKRKESKDDIIKAVHDMNDLNIRTSSFNMLGLPFDDRSTIMETISLNKISKVKYPNCGFFYPLDGTKLRDISVQNDFFKPDKDSLLDTNKPCLRLPGISENELIKVRERFLLYIKMPESFYRFIERSEVDDEVGYSLTRKLFDIYEKYIFNNNGIWDVSGEKLSLYYLNNIIGKYRKDTYNL